MLRARERQLERYKDLNSKSPAKHKVHKNADLSSKLVQEYCVIGDDAQQLMKMAMSRMGLSALAYDRILKVGRTIADLAGAESISSTHISEAIQYRSLDRQFWNA